MTSGAATSSKTVASAEFRERHQRLQDALQLRKPDRVPIMMPFGNLVADLAGITRQAAYEDPALAQSALEQAALRFQPDVCTGLFHTPGPSRALGDRMTKWPGYGLEPNTSFQYHESELMKADDYDAFLADPTDWAVRKYLPRAFSELEGLALLPPLAVALKGYYAIPQFSHMFVVPPVVTAMSALAKAAQLQMEWIHQQIQSIQRMASLGFPPFELFMGADATAPFDFMSDTLRGMSGIFMDMRRYPEKLLAAEEKVVSFQVEAAVATCHTRNNWYALIPLHRGSDGLISIKQFERFYWPQLKDLLLKLIDAGITPFVFWEGVWDQRLKYLAELPKGKTIGMFQGSDLFKVKEMLGETMCIFGGMPNSLLVGGTPREVREHTKRICQCVGQGGGFVMTTTVSEMEGCRPELVEAWAEATYEFGVV